MASAHAWNFFRAGGFDQVQIETGADLVALGELDQKLWVALSCPARGIEFDAATLGMIDSDADGHVRAGEVLAAIEWAASKLTDPDLLVKGGDFLSLCDIDEQTPDGARLAQSARHILKSLGKPDAPGISLEDMADIGKFVALQPYNGDGVITPQQAGEMGAVVADIIGCCGGQQDLSGEAGIDQDTLQKFFEQAASLSDWYESAQSDASILFLNDATEAAAAAYHAARDKVEDYFTRCQLAAFDPRAALPLSRSVEDYQQLASGSLSPQSAEVANFPLAFIVPDKPLPLVMGVNPAWGSVLANLNELVVLPLLGKKETLSREEWAYVCARFAAFDAWHAAKPASAVEALGMPRLREILASGNRQRILDLIAQDKAVEAEVRAIGEVEKLLRYKRDLFTLVNNFVSFRNFYTGRDKAIFQVGTLYLDGRSCELVVRVDDVTRHAGFAAMSGVCLVYCECVRGTEKTCIAAAFTAGDSDYLMVGRNGIFYDRKGLDWDATIVRIVDHPISMRQAFWSPYKKLVKAVSEQIQKLAASRAGAAEGNMIKAVVENGKAVVNPPAAPKPPFDVGKFAGIFAAIGLAIGAIGGMLASIVGGVLGLKFWQIPLAIAGLVLLVSGPAVLMAWFKLKKRSLAPILDANGWAINARARINIPFGTSLTRLASLPEGSRRSLVDPFAEKRVVWPYYALTLVAICALAVSWYFFGRR